MTSVERKNAMPRGGQRRAARRVGRSESFITLVMNDGFRPRTPRGERTLKRARTVIAGIIGKPVDEVFPTEQPAPALAS